MEKLTRHVVWCRYLTCTVIDVAACLDDVAYQFHKNKNEHMLQNAANIL